MEQRFLFHLFKSIFGVIFVLYLTPKETAAMDYDVAEIKCDPGEEFLTAKLRKPDGFRGVPIFADDPGSNTEDHVNKYLLKDEPCQIFPHKANDTGSVFIVRVTDFSKCGVFKKNGFIYVRVWFPQLPGVVMLSDREVVIKCKPPKPTIAHSITTGFAGIKHYGPLRPFYEAALFRDTGSPSTIGKSSPGARTDIAGVDSNELPLDEAVPIGTRLQLRVVLNYQTWPYAKLMEITVSPDPEDANAEGSIALIKLGSRNPDLASIIPRQPCHRYGHTTNEVLLDFESFLLSNKLETNRLWLHIKVKACMESQDCRTDLCIPVYPFSGKNQIRKRRKRHSHEEIKPTTKTTITIDNTITSAENFRLLAQHTRVFPENRSYELNETSSEEFSRGYSEEEEDEKIGNNNSETMNANEQFKKVDKQLEPLMRGKDDQITDDDTIIFNDHIEFYVLPPSANFMPSESLLNSCECRLWTTGILFTLILVLVAVAMSCVVKLKRFSSYKGKLLYHIRSSNVEAPIPDKTKEYAATVM